MSSVVEEVRGALTAAAAEKTRRGYRRFFKEYVVFHGVGSAKVKKIGKGLFDNMWSKAEVFSFCEELFASGYCEEAFIAADWAYRVRGHYVPGDLRLFERWVGRYVDNWAKCDSLCNHAIGAFFEMYPQNVRRLRGWAKSKNRWMRRAAAVTLVLPARKGLFQDDVFGIADILMGDGDDMVQKGYGWMLKEASKADMKRVFDYVMENKDKMPRTSLRYAIEKMPKRLRMQAMAK